MYDTRAMIREESLKLLKSESYDLLVIGGGATGSGVALDAASRGLRVALIERFDFASGTSSRSTKLIHGGVRYLELAVKRMDRGQYKLVKEALHERATLLKIAPHLVKRIALLTPLYSRFEVPYYLTGLKLYDWIAGRSGLEPSHFVGEEELIKKFPMLKREGLRGAVVYYDGQFNDARMNLALVHTASQLGAAVANYIEVTGLIQRSGKIAGVKALDHETGDTFEIAATSVVNACGPYVDSVRRLDDPSIEPMLTVSSGAHIILDKKFSPPATGLLIPKTEDGRVLFLLPWQGHTLVGTTEQSAKIVNQPQPSDGEIDFILHELTRYFAVTVEKKDILASWSGLRPLVSSPQSGDTAGLSRDHFLAKSKSGLITITGGKWTTYRKMALDTVDFAIKTHGLKAKGKCHTHELLLIGAKDFNSALPVKLEATFGFDPDVAEHLANSYGGEAFEIGKLAKEGFSTRLHPDYPHLEAEILYVIRFEMARNVDDILSRRLRLRFLNAKVATEIRPKVEKLIKDLSPGLLSIKNINDAWPKFP